jgi:hypothetical protein
MAHEANRGRERIGAMMVDGLSKGNKGWTTHTHMKFSLKQQKMQIYILPSSCCNNAENKRRRW